MNKGVDNISLSGGGSSRTSSSGLSLDSLPSEEEVGWIYLGLELRDTDNNSDLYRLGICRCRL